MTTATQPSPSPWMPLLVRLEDYPEMAEIVVNKERARHLDSESTGDAIALPTIQLAGNGSGELATRTPRTSIGVLPVPRQESWPALDLRRLIASQDAVVTVHRLVRGLDVVATHAPTLIGSSQVCDESGMTRQEWGDTFRHLPRHLAAHYPDRRTWPIEGIRGRDLGKDDQIYWGLTSEAAELWRTLRSER